jgi:hypothetical protein
LRVSEHPPRVSQFTFSSRYRCRDSFTGFDLGASHPNQCGGRIDTRLRSFDDLCCEERAVVIFADE